MGWWIAIKEFLVTLFLKSPANARADFEAISEKSTTLLIDMIGD